MKKKEILSPFLHVKNTFISMLELKQSENLHLRWMDSLQRKMQFIFLMMKYCSQNLLQISSHGV